MFGYETIIHFVLAVVAILFAIILHEIAHGLVALWNGDNTAKLSGRLTLNPLAHFDLVGFVMLVLMRFGYAKPVPINPYNFKRRKLGMFTVAIAGIALNLILAFVAVPLLIISKNEFLSIFLSYFILININLAVFNILPIYPLDGSRILECFIGRNNGVMRFLEKYSLYVIVVLFGLGIVRDMFNLPIYFDPLSLYINYARGFIIDIFEKFWLLII